jgi:hypothetical protein
MNPKPLENRLGIVMIHILLSAWTCTEAASNQAIQQPFRLEHSGLLQSSKSTASLHGIGNTIIFHDEFELYVDGQFRLIGSTRLVKMPTGNRQLQLRHEPVFVSIVALGDVRLKFPMTGKTICGNTAVYRVSEGSWTLDGNCIDKTTAR